MIRSQENISIVSCNHPTWKLYENPFYLSHNNNNNHNHSIVKQQNKQEVHSLNLPISARKIAASFWDLTFIRSSYMVSELESARAQILKLKNELEYERKTCKKLESVNKKLARELSDERKMRDVMQKTWDRLKKKIEEERKMIRVAEVLREERVQMKLSDAKFLYEEKIMELEKSTKNLPSDCVGVLHRPCTSLLSSNAESSNKTQENLSKTKNIVTSVVSCSSNKNRAMVINHPRKSSSEPENPHIKSGIKGFVEFPKVVKAIGSKSRHFSSKLECQKAQLKLLLMGK